MVKLLMRLLVAFGGAAALVAALALLLALPQPVQAGGIACQDVYTVRRGDTLTGIALRLGLAYDELLAANRDRLANPDRIYAGQVLCLPKKPAEESPGESALASKVVLESWYTYTPTEDEDLLPLARNGLVSKRVELPLVPTGPVSVFTLTREITPVLTSETAPMLIGMRNRTITNSLLLTYTLVAVGRGSDVLARLALSHTAAITPSTAMSQARSLQAFLADPNLSWPSLYFIGETEDGVRMPFEVSAVDVVPDYAAFKRFYLDRPPPVNSPGLVWADDIGYALLARPGGRYQLLLRLSEDGYGPPGWGTQVRCQDWRRKRGLWFWFFRAWYGCRG